MRDEDRLELIIKNALNQQHEAEETLNRNIKKQIREKSGMEHNVNRKKKFVPSVVMVSLMVLIMSVTVIGATRFLSSKQAAEKMGYTAIAKAFEGDNAIQLKETQEVGDYQISLLGITSNGELANLLSPDTGIETGSTYAVVAIAKKDGTPMPDTTDENFFVSPLIKGLNPGQYNIASMNGGYCEDVIDGIMYRIIQCDNVEVFADKGLYLCVNDGPFYNSNAYNYDEATGEITVNENYDGINLLFDLPLDKDKADPDKAAVYLEGLQAQWNGEVAEDLTPEMQEAEDKANAQADYLNDVLDEVAAAIKDGTMDAYITDHNLIQEKTQTIAGKDGVYEVNVEGETLYFYEEDFTNGMNCYAEYVSTDGVSYDNIAYNFITLNGDGTAEFVQYIGDTISE